MGEEVDELDRRSPSPTPDDGPPNSDLLPQGHDRPPAVKDRDEDTAEGFDITEWRNYVLDNERPIPIDQLVWDHKGEMGQVRPLRQAHVRYYVSKLMATGHPVSPVAVLTKMLPDQCIFFIVLDTRMSAYIF